MQLNAGKLTMQYENGFLRWISAEEAEVLRMIYFAVRDKDWNTIPGNIYDEHVQVKEKSFFISYQMKFEQDNISMLWQASIQGKENNTITFEIKGKALSAFQKNRTGFCVLHPIKECAGNKVWLHHADTSTEENIFPYYISPHQPFKNIRSMKWKPAENCTAMLMFDGDIFETEDQRNWSDDSYKTYCTPLAIPIPATMKEGDEVQQKIILAFAGDCIAKKITTVTDVLPDKKSLLPKIGIARANERNKNYHQALKLLSALNFSHYRIEIKLSHNNWQQTLEECFVEAALLKTKLEIALFVYNNCDENLLQFVKMINERNNVSQIILLEENAKCIGNELLKKMLSLLRAGLHNVLIGAGTDSDFTELNRSNLDAAALDFVSYAVNPQVHTFDDASVLENATAQFYAVETALHKFKKPVHLSPVTLKARPGTDERQQTDFCATWTKKSLKALIKAGASSVTYFETVGKKGLINAETLRPFSIFNFFKDLCDEGLGILNENI